MTPREKKIAEDLERHVSVHTGRHSPVNPGGRTMYLIALIADLQEQVEDLKKKQRSRLFDGI
jgi:hypothetical protein